VSFARPAEAARVSGDRDELYEVFENLVENAIKYSDDGGTVEVTLEPAARPGFEWRAVVADHGPGIAPEHVPRLTERFYRVEADTARKKKGTGLGLAIVKHILNRHQGHLTIRSALGEGTSVEVLLKR
jgi:two-component system phosphate regulon sensor histidine kinase PhoR